MSVLKVVSSQVEKIAVPELDGVKVNQTSFPTISRLLGRHWVGSRGYWPGGLLLACVLSIGLRPTMATVAGL